MKYSNEMKAEHINAWRLSHAVGYADKLVEIIESEMPKNFVIEYNLTKEINNEKK